MKAGYLSALAQTLGELLLRLHLVRSEASNLALVVAVGVGLFCLGVGLILACRIFAAASAPAIAGITLTTAGIFVGLDAVRFQLEPLGLVPHAIFAVAGLGLVVLVTTRALDTTPSRAIGTLVVGTFFGALIATLLGMAVQLSDAI